MSNPRGPFGPMRIEIEPIAEPNLANGVAKCLDEFVLQSMTQDQLYATVRDAMMEYYEQMKAYQVSQQRQTDPQGHEGLFAAYRAILERRRQENDES